MARAAQAAASKEAEEVSKGHDPRTEAVLESKDKSQKY